MTRIRTLTGLGMKEFLADLIRIKENPLEQLSFAKYQEAPFSTIFEPVLDMETQCLAGQLAIELMGLLDRQSQRQNWGGRGHGFKRGFVWRWV